MDDLAAASGVGRRTIRYYIGRGLLPRPESTGRGAHYRTEHLESLERIGHLKAQGLTLAEIGSLLAGAHRAGELPEPETFRSYRIAPDVIVMVRSDSSPWRLSRIGDAMAEMRTRLGSQRDTPDAERGGPTEDSQGGTGN